MMSVSAEMSGSSTNSPPPGPRRVPAIWGYSRMRMASRTTARLACDLGYEVTFVTEATATFPAPHWELPEDVSVEELLADPRTLGTADILARTEYALAGRFATIATVEQVVDGAAHAHGAPSGNQG